MLTLLHQAILPPVRLGDCLTHWDAIVRGLSEPPRQRRLQVEELEDALPECS